MPTSYWSLCWGFGNEQTYLVSWSTVLGMILEKPLHFFVVVFILDALSAALLKIVIKLNILLHSSLLRELTDLYQSSTPLLITTMGMEISPTDSFLLWTW